MKSYFNNFSVLIIYWVIYFLIRPYQNPVSIVWREKASLLKLQLQFVLIKNMAAKKRSSRVGSTSSSSHRSEAFKPVKSQRNRHRRLTISLCILFFIISLLIYCQRYYYPAATTVVDAEKPYVYQRGLVKIDSTYSEILNVTYSVLSKFDFFSFVIFFIFFWFIWWILRIAGEF